MKHGPEQGAICGQESRRYVRKSGEVSEEMCNAKLCRKLNSQIHIKEFDSSVFGK